MSRNIHKSRVVNQTLFFLPALLFLILFRDNPYTLIILFVPLFSFSQRELSRAFGIQYREAFAPAISIFAFSALSFLFLHKTITNHPLTFLRQCGFLLATAAMITLLSRLVLKLSAGPVKQSKQVSRIPIKTAWWSNNLASVAFLCFQIWLLAKKGIPGLAWALSGDARNHLWLSYQVGHFGGLSLKDFSWYPALSEGTLELLTNNQTSKPVMTQGSLSHAILGLGLLSMILLICLSIIFTSIYTLLLGDNSYSVGATIVGFLPFMGVIAGVALSDGYFSAIMAMVFASASILIHCLHNSSDAKNSATRWLFVVSQALLIPVLVATWTVFACVPAFLLATKLLQLFRDNPRSTLLMAFVSLVPTIAALVLIKPLISSGKAKFQIGLDGAIHRPDPFVTVVILLVAILLLVYSSYRRTFNEITLLSLPLIFACIVGKMLTYQVPTHLWNYYPAKTTWFAISIMLPVILAVLFKVIKENIFEHLNLGKFSPMSYYTKWKMEFGEVKLFFGRATIIAFGALLVVQSLSIPMVVNPLLPRTLSFPDYSNWQAPSSTVIQDLLSNRNLNKNSVYWEKFDPSNDRLGNFWLSTLRSGNYRQMSWPNNSLSYWAYIENPTDVKSLCQLIGDGSSELDIVTSNPNASNEIISGCPKAAKVKVY
jgi:hypothetical protein